MQKRPYQEDAETGVQQKFLEKYRKILLVLFMGLGKTFIASNIIKRAVNNNKRVLFIAHRYELIEQAATKFISEGMEVGIIMSSFKEERDKPVQVASIQTLNRRSLPPANLVVIDEAHRSISKEYLAVLREYEKKGAYFIGLTATPFRTKKKEAFNVFWDTWFRPITVKSAIQKGYVCQSKVYACARIVAANIQKDGEGEFNKVELMKAFDTDEVYVNLISNYNELIGKDKAIVFCVNKDHSRKTCQALLDAGYRAVYVDSDTDPDERKEIVKAYKRGEYDVLVNVEIFTEGFDCPDIKAVVLNMATTSKAKYFQCAGRGSRILSDGSKQLYKILDMADNTKRFGFVEDDFEPTLEPTNKYTKLGVAPVKDCLKCGYMMHASLKVCPECNTPVVVTATKGTIKEEKFIEMMREEIAVEPYLEYTKDQWKYIPSDVLAVFAKKKSYSKKWLKHQLAARGEGDKQVRIKNYPGTDRFVQEAWLQKAYYKQIPIDAKKWGSPTITDTELIFEYRLNKQEA